MLEINKIYQGNCLDVMKSISDKSIDMIFCDLPYSITAAEWDKSIDLNTLWSFYKNILKENGVVIFTAAQPFTTDLINSNRKWFKYSWYWLKNQGTNFFHAKRMPIRKVEDVLIFYKKKCIYNPQKTKGHIPTSSAKGCSNGKLYYGNKKRNYEGGSTERFPNNILEFKCVDNYSRIHPTEKPTELLEYLIKTYTNENMIVLDPVIGSGSTVLAAMNTKRNFIGIEQNEEYFKMATDRIENHKKILSEEKTEDKVQDEIYETWKQRILEEEQSKDESIRRMNI